MEESNMDIIPKKRNRWLRIFFWFIILLLLFILLLPLLIHISPIQNWLVDRATNKISEKTGAEISVEKVDFSVYKGLILENLFVSNPSSKTDTLAYIGKFSSTLDENIASLISNKLALKDITVSDVQLNIVTEEGNSSSNLETLLSLLINGDQKGGTGKPLDLNIEKVNFDRVAIKVDDGPESSKMRLTIQEGYLNIQELDLENQKFWFKELMLSEPNYIYLKNGSSIVEEEISLQNETIDTSISPLALQIDYIEISNGKVFRDDWYKAPRELENSLDVDHLHIIGINLNADSTSLEFPFNLNSQIKSLTLIEESGFEINQLNVGDLSVTEQGLELNDFILETGKSRLGKNLAFRYVLFLSRFGWFSLCRNE